MSKKKDKKVHTEATAALLAFANPPDFAQADAVARECTAQGLVSIGINGPFNDGDIIDFGPIDEASCQDLAHSIELCVDSKGFEVPALSGAFIKMHANKMTITFGNLVKAITNVMTKK
jgi:hypothetical protein